MTHTTQDLSAEQIAEGREAFDNITHSMIQLDEDGINVSVSRQALAQVLTVAARICYPEAYPPPSRPDQSLIASPTLTEDKSGLERSQAEMQRETALRAYRQLCRDIRGSVHVWFEIGPDFQKRISSGADAQFFFDGDEND